MRYDNPEQDGDHEKQPLRLLVSWVGLFRACVVLLVPHLLFVDPAVMERKQPGACTSALGPRLA
jgi:hypothetical protein